MQKLKFYITKTDLPLDKLSLVLGGYGIVQNCATHKSTEINPNLNNIQELIIDSTEYPAALLFPAGYTINEESSVGQYPERTILFFKRHLKFFEQIRNKFNLAKFNTEFDWPCGCKIRKYDYETLKNLCSDPWFPWIGECEQPYRPDDLTIWTPKRKSLTVANIVGILRDADIIDEEDVKMAIKVLESHRK